MLRRRFWNRRSRRPYTILCPESQIDSRQARDGGCYDTAESRATAQPHSPRPQLCLPASDAPAGPRMPPTRPRRRDRPCVPLPPLAPRAATSVCLRRARPTLRATSAPPPSTPRAVPSTCLCRVRLTLCATASNMMPGPSPYAPPPPRLRLLPPCRRPYSLKLGKGGAPRVWRLVRTMRWVGEGEEEDKYRRVFLSFPLFFSVFLIFLIHLIGSYLC